MNSKRERRLQDSESPIELLRIQRTKLSQNEFAIHCDIPPRTYQRWIAGKTEAKLSPRQWKALMQILNLTADEIPDDFGAIEQDPAS
ncbi:MAG: helix-turn-helix domain-containing protein [Drouetiella hepatica Uher 2000/2452]|jgi:DNA-binding transcriptional regulator YiaG|uniref:Helix-turn-helix domain-containing protein n=1 Tax=Drouetiella hepatica Uher 2000/2452 TaxID=904376 RepID=A0A951QDE0_9CYAN|nr:helix-turn-helix domain-containing protein [Drouetiella hepatica Uher 2000/2452]